MYYFIPAWYGSNRPWHADLIPWYFSQFRFEFDDTFNQIRLFQGQEIESQILVLSYQPHLRYYLHRHGVLETETYSVFDDMQDLQDVHTQVLNIRDIEWDRDCQFLYSPFAIVVQKSGRKYAKIEHGIEGFISDIQYFQTDGQLSQHYIMDDRGLVSSVIYFEGGVPSYQDYLNPNGVWQFREYIQDAGRIEINPIFSYRFNKLEYPDMGCLIAEFLDKFLQKNLQMDDTFIIPSHPHHNQFVFDHLPSENIKILSLFVGRNSQESFRELASSFEQAHLIIVDREDRMQLLQELYPEKLSKFHHLSPFDTRLTLGRSQTRKESIIYFQLDFSESIDKEALFQVLSFVSKNQNTEVVFGAFSASQEQMEEVQTVVDEIIQEKISIEALEKEVDYGGAENPLEENQNQESRFQFVNMNDELELMKTLEFVRLIVDLNKHPHLYTQIAGISAGIPQINKVETAYVEHLKNGYVISDITEFSQGAHYYIDRLKEWNQSLIYSVDKIKEHTGQRFLEKLQDWIEEVRHVKES